jgi:hypothetical protein
VKEFLDYFTSLDSLEEVLEVIVDVKDDAKKATIVMTINKNAHNVMATKFKQKEDKIDKVLAKCSLEKKRLERQVQELNKRIDKKNTWCTFCAFVPGVNAVACPLLDKSISDDMIKALAAKEEAQLAVNASYATKEVLGKAIQGYTKAIDTAACCLAVIVEELQSFETKLDKLEEKKKDAFFKMCKKKAIQVSQACQSFTSFANTAKTDMDSLPDSKDQKVKNYVQQWLDTHGQQGKSPSFAKQIQGQSGKVIEDVKKKLALK